MSKKTKAVATSYLTDEVISELTAKFNRNDLLHPLEKGCDGLRPEYVGKQVGNLLAALIRFAALLRDHYFELPVIPVKFMDLMSSVAYMDCSSENAEVFLSKHIFFPAQLTHFGSNRFLFHNQIPVFFEFALDENRTMSVCPTRNKHHALIQWNEYTPLEMLGPYDCKTYPLRSIEMSTSIVLPLDFTTDIKGVKILATIFDGSFCEFVVEQDHLVLKGTQVYKSIVSLEGKQYLH